MAKRTVTPRFLQMPGDFVEGILRLRDRHAVAGDDDHALRVFEEPGGIRGGDGRDFALGFAGGAPGRSGAFAGAEAAENHARKRAIHRAAHDIAENGAARPDERAGDDEQIIVEHETGRGGRPARVAIEHRDDDRHIRAADGHDQMHADDAGDERHREQRSKAGAAADAQEMHACTRHFEARPQGFDFVISDAEKPRAQEQASQEQAEIEPVPGGKQERFAPQQRRAAFRRRRLNR